MWECNCEVEDTEKDKNLEQNEAGKGDKIDTENVSTINDRTENMNNNEINSAQQIETSTSAFKENQLGVTDLNTDRNDYISSKIETHSTQLTKVDENKAKNSNKLKEQNSNKYNNRDAWRIASG
ncbi:hypothetical protein SNE40_019893 [Patella caerulea]|uniref:Uncharacterized protein n=1 Tax=Patella caerulea TaxID=87958 RepID=A0AAN8IY07_PATCE